MSTDRVISSFAKALGFCLISIAVTACSTLAESSNVSGNWAVAGMGASQLLHSDLTGFFENALVGETVHAAITPWGDDVVIAAAEQYDAASGRQCRNLSVSINNSTTYPALVCQVGVSQWESVRAITQGSGL